MLDELEQDPGDMTEQPPLPKGGIPKQYLPRFVRTFIQILCLPYVYLELMALWVAKKVIKPPFEATGSCKRRGNCCYYIRFKKTKYLDPFQTFWATQVNGFFFRSKKAVDVGGKKYYTMGCRHLTKDGQCGNYHLRPLICRTWPVIEHFGAPQFLKGCGYSYRLRKKYDKNNALNIVE